MFFEEIKLALSTLPLAVQIMGLMVVLAVVDFAAALVEHTRNQTLHGTLVGQWVTSKGLPIVTVALLYGADQAVKLFTVEIGDFDLGLFGALAYAQGISFIAAQGFSIVKHLQAKPPEEPVPNELPGG